VVQKTFTELVDDLDGGAADETVRFGLDGALYEIDLSEPNATDLRETLAPFVTAARRVKRDGTAATGRTRSADRSGEIRGWARANGYTVSDRGRISATVIEAFEAEQAA